MYTFLVLFVILTSLLVITSSQFSIPDEFQMKMQVWVHTSASPFLVLLHYSRELSAARLDYYHLSKLDQEGNDLDDFHHLRFYTDLHHWQDSKRYLIYHKQPKSPKLCLVTTAEHELHPHDYLERAKVVDMGQVPIPVLDDIIPYASSNETCLHMRMKVGMELGDFSQIDLCIGEDGSPYLIHTPMFKARVLHFKADSQPFQLFEPERITDAPCSEFV